MNQKRDGGGGRRMSSASETQANTTSLIDRHFVQVQAGPVSLEGNLDIPQQATGLIVFVHGSGSSHNSPRNQFVASELQKAGLATLLFDLLTPEEEEVDIRTRHMRFDISLLARRAIGAADWLSQQKISRDLKLGFFGASTGAAAALIAAAERPEITGAVVSRGGRPDLAFGSLPRVVAPVLFIVGQLDNQVIELNQQALEQMQPRTAKKMVVVPGASHLFEEPGALECVSSLAKEWFTNYISSELKQKNKG